MAGIAIPYHFQSVNTKFIAISMKEDKVGQKVVAKRFIPEDASVRAQLSTPASHSFYFLVRFYSPTALLGLSPLL